MRQIILDTETTGRDVPSGHRVIDIGCIELVERLASGSTYQCYLNPDRDSDPEALAVHQISNAFLADKPRFYEVVEEFLAYVKGAQLLIHNASFDVGFINGELARASARKGAPDYGKLEDYCEIVDTLKMARKQYPGQRNSLDALCKRLDVDNSGRTAHGALLDAHLLLEVYLAMTRGQHQLALDPAQEGGDAGLAAAAAAAKIDFGTLVRFVADAQATAAHEQRLQALDKTSKGNCMWRSMDAAVAPAE